MEKVTKRLYEAMFLVDSALAASGWDETMKVIETFLERAKAEVVSIRKWDERKLAYEVNKVSRGTYILCYFKTDTQMITNLERDVKLSDKVLRVLVTNAEHYTEEEVAKETPAMAQQRQATEAADARIAAEEKAKEQAEAKAKEQAEAKAEEQVEVKIEAEVEAETEETVEPDGDKAEAEAENDTK